MCDLRLDELGATGPVVVDGPLAGDPLFLAVLAALRPASAIHAAPNRAGTLRGALVLAGAVKRDDGVAAGAPAIAPLEAPGLEAHRQRWRAQSVDLTNPPASSHQ